MKHKRKESGSALLIVLSLLTAGTILVSFLLGNSHRTLKRWERNRNKIQSLYLAESGIAYQLFLEKEKRGNYQLTKDTILSIDAEEVAVENANQLSFTLNPDLPWPEVTTEEGTFLTIKSSSHYKDEVVTLKTRFGRALTDSLFSSALVLTSSTKSIGMGVTSQVAGDIYSANKRMASEALLLDSSMTVEALVGDYVNNLKITYKNELNDNLGAEGGNSGNGDYTEYNLPDFSENTTIVYPLGDIHFSHGGAGCLQIKGPGQFYAHGDIYVTGCVHFENIKLYAGRSIHFEDSISSHHLMAYTEKNLYILGTSVLDIQAMAEIKIVMEEQAQTTYASVLISTGLQSKDVQKPLPPLKGVKAKGKVSTGKAPSKTMIHSGIYLKDQVQGRGIFIATGMNGTFELSSEESEVNGIILSAKQAWINGLLKGVLMTNSLVCQREGRERGEHCLENGEIKRQEMSPQIVLPLDLGKGILSEVDFKLLDWEWEKE